MLDAFLQDLRYSLRALRTSPGFAAVAILSLALGIGANTAIFSLIDSVMLKYLPVSHPEELLNVTLGDSLSWTNPIWEQVRDHQDVFSGVSAYSPLRFNLAAGGEASYAQGLWVSGDFFSMLGVRTVLGRSFTTADDRRGCPGVAVLSYDFWRRQYGGSAAALEKTVSIDGHPFPILGVTEPGFFGVEVGRSYDVALPICAEAITRGAGTQLDARSSWWLRVVGRPKPGVSPQQATARLKTLAPQIFAATIPPNWPPDSQEEYRHRTFETLPAANGLSRLRTQYRQALFTLMAMVGVVLLIACANVANLLLARAAIRQREIAIRMAIGASRARLIRQLVTESLLLSLAGAGLGVLFARSGTRMMVGFLSSSNNQVSLDLAIDGRILAFTIGVGVLTGLMFGLAPAWRGTRVQPQSAMRANARGIAEGHSRFSLGKVLVMAQVALSIVLVTGAGLMLGTFWKLASLDSGFDRQNVMLVSVDLRNGHYPKDRLPAVYDEMLERLRAVPGVYSASHSNNTPVSGNSWNNMIQVDGFVSKSRRDNVVWMNSVSAGYFETLGTPILAGRDFNSRDMLAAPQVAIINEAMAKRFYGNKNPIGQHFRTGFPQTSLPIEVVGVVKDAKYQNLREESSATAYLPANQSEFGVSRSFALRTAGPVADLVPGVKSAMEQVNHDIALEFRTLAVQVAESLNRERLLATLSGFFGALALLLAIIGLYGVMSYNVTRRRNEIGIRMALGAEQGRVLRMVLGEVALLTGIGMAVGLAAAFASTRFVSSFLYGVSATDPLTYALAAGVLGAAATLAGYLPARRASRLDPMVALREE